MALYNITAIAKNTTGVLSFAQSINNELMFGWLGIIFLIGLAIVILTTFVYLTNDVKKSVIAASFITFIFSVFFRAMNLANDLTVFICLIGCAGIVGFCYIAYKDE